jgi:Ca2+-binding RTX toxin-like protein
MVQPCFADGPLGFAPSTTNQDSGCWARIVRVGRQASRPEAATFIFHRQHRLLDLREADIPVIRKPFAVLAAGSLAVALSIVGAASASSATTPTCFGKPATRVGTAGPDTLIGQSGVSDVIYGAGGNDTIIGGDFYGEDHKPGAAPDLLCGGPGSDHITDSPGSDKLNGGDGSDWLETGGLGNDLLQGNAGHDVVEDTSCEDCGSGNDVLHGNGGNDILSNGWGKDKVYGDAGADELTDTECDGPTYLNGGRGNDILESWSSSFNGWHDNVCNQVSDTIIGGRRTDTAEVDRLDSVTGVEHVTRITKPTQ